MGNMVLIFVTIKIRKNGTYPNIGHIPFFYFIKGTFSVASDYYGTFFYLNITFFVRLHNQCKKSEPLSSLAMLFVEEEQAPYCDNQSSLESHIQYHHFA